MPERAEQASMRSGIANLFTPFARPSSPVMIDSAMWGQSVELSSIATIKMPFDGSFIPSRTTRSPMVEPACLRRSGQVRWIAGFPRNAPPWALHLFLLRPVSRCYFKGKSCWKIAGSRIKSRSTGLELRTNTVFSTCTGI